MNIISLGAGVQSSTIALMAAKGEITPMPDAAIFSDTGWEPKAVYEWLEWLEKQLPFPVYKVMHKEGLKNAQWDGIRNSKVNIKIQIPVHTVDRDTMQAGMVNRICTVDFKIVPVIKKTKELLGLKKGARLPTEPVCTTWVGISKDEIQRMKESREKFIKHRWPLIEMNMTRLHCLEWMEKNGFPRPPRSSCIICPFHDDNEWRNLTAEEFEEACQFDDFIRNKGGMKGDLFIHRKRVPLREADLSDPHQNQIDLFGNECEGMCGV
jgi:hypothetical protein